MAQSYLSKDEKEILLLKDKRLPSSRGRGIYAYQLEAVVTYQTALVVVVSYTKPGFEGPDDCQLFITAQIP